MTALAARWPAANSLVPSVNVVVLNGED